MVIRLDLSLLCQCKAANPQNRISLIAHLA